MGRDQTAEPEQTYGYHGDETPPADTGPVPTIGGADAEANRGARAPAEGSGGVIGSGASAGGGGGAEDHDSDTAGGGGAMPRHPELAPADAGDAPKHGSR